MIHFKILFDGKLLSVSISFDGKCKSSKVQQPPLCLKLIYQVPTTTSAKTKSCSLFSPKHNLIFKPVDMFK